MGKIFEKLFSEKLIAKEDGLKIIIPQQFGFCNGYPTVQQVLRITEHASRNFNLNRSTGIVLLDNEKASDSVWHDTLTHHIFTLNFPINLVKTIQS